jgi:hypothetical protein
VRIGGEMDGVDGEGIGGIGSNCATTITRFEAARHKTSKFQ